MDELEIVLASYRDMFGVKTERANEIHRLACEEVARLRAVEHSVQATELTCPACQVERQILLRCPKCMSLDAPRKLLEG